ARRRLRPRLAVRSQPPPRPAHLQRVVDRLHHEQDDRPLRPPAHGEAAEEPDRPARDLSDEAELARDAAAAVDEDRPEQPEEVRPGRIANGLDLGVRPRPERRRDRDAGGVVDTDAPSARTDDRLRVGPNGVPDTRAAEARAAEQL